ncbi:hypothetical protein K443DRAFT_258253 [Laccaria amethystina LaAM-08-1]|uniref:Uncharacterized protein n=1 Tax=Laccaria amethystina LaAM-08-1 TaxID=1095629 RepID=A0A0C9X742_9AGAR|nr:hypothetical protein K443DRAFT_258253 [Laccaria amethystina LaAM-08-1]
MCQDAEVPTRRKRLLKLRTCPPIHLISPAPRPRVRPMPHPSPAACFHPESRLVEGRGPRAGLREGGASGERICGGRT